MPLPQLLFLHALPLDGTMWRAEIERYGGQAIAPSLYLFGKSLHEWATGVLEMASDGPLIVIGCSVGGSCALEVAYAAPDRVLGVVMVGAKAGVRPDPTLRDEAIGFVRNEGLQKAWGRYWSPIFGRDASPEVLRAARETALLQHPDHIVDGLRAFHDRRDLTDFARAWQGTIVSISGDQDRSPSAAANDAWTSLPNRSSHIVGDCGHYVNLEQPQRFQELLDDALTLISQRV